MTIQHRSLGRYAAIAIALAPMSANAQQAVKVSSFDQGFVTTTVTGSVGEAQFSLACGTVPTENGRVTRDSSLDRIVSKAPDGYAQATEIGGKVVVLTPTSDNRGTVISVLGADKSVTSKQYNIDITSPAYTLPGAGRPTSAPISFQYGVGLAGTAHVLCDGIIKAKQGDFDTSPEAIKGHVAELPVYRDRREQFLQAVTR
jgi:hypothetical protein